ncbi:MAG TPA: WYL domain-containing protein, partial [Ktedonobacterales bacterium]|nr:WYL domain-containing protein [Ktedonobacterales bacterium]
GRWYLATSDTDYGERERLWRADRVTGISPHSQMGERRADFDIGNLLGHAWLRTAMAAWRARAPVRLRITEEQAQRLQRDWYYRFAHYEPDGDGRVIMTIGERDRGLVLALVRWLGPGAELLTPAEWRDTLREQLAAMVRNLA